MTAIRKYGLLMAGILLLVGALIVGAAGLPALAQGNGSGYGPGWGGMMGGGMMGQGTGGMMGNYGTQPNANAKRLSGDQVRERVTSYLNSYYNGQALAIAEIMEFQNNFYAQIKEQATSINAFELLIDPSSGNVWPEYGPNMMWNTKYGHMGSAAGMGSMMGGSSGGMMGGYSQANPPTADMPVKPEQALQDAKGYLQAQGTGLTVENELDTFYGYYTIHTLKDGKVTGMLSVNGYTGQVWYHTWHGTFIGTVGSSE